jgi:site-specific recombinase XerD
MSAAVVDFDPTRDLRHREARAARELADFLSWLDLGGTARATLETYEWTIAHALRMFPSKSMVDFTDGDLLHVIRRFPPKSRRVRLAAFRSWFKWAKRTRRIQENPCDYLPDIKRTAQRVIDVLTDAEVETLVGLPIVDGGLMAILFGGGLRKSEARRLKTQHWNPEQRTLAIIDGKGGKDRLVGVERPLAQRIEDLMRIERLDLRRDHFWYMVHANAVTRSRRRDRPIGAGTFHRWWVDCLAEADVRYRNPHVARHTFAM